MSASSGRYGVVGTGWRAEFYLRLARLMPDRFVATGVVSRTEERGAEIERRWGIASYRTIADLLTAERPEFVVISVPRSVTPHVIEEIVRRDIPVLAETPPASDLSALRSLWSRVGTSGLVQVAEQYSLMPNHAARSTVLRSGAIGDVTSVQISSTHLYHAVALMRSMLGVGFDVAEVAAKSFTSRLADPVSRDGWSGHADPMIVSTTLATIDFGVAMGLYDFTDNQWLNPLRTPRFIARGSLGELVDDRVVRLVKPLTAVESSLVRRQTGVDLNLEGFDLHHISFDGSVVYDNPFYGARLSDEEIAIATLLHTMVAWCRGNGRQPYRLADACQDHLIGLAIDASAQTGMTVTTSHEQWQSSRYS